MWSPDAVLVQALQACDAFGEALGHQGLTTLATVNRWISGVARELISRRYRFYLCWENRFGSQLRWYHPVRGLCDDWTPDGSRITLASSLTHLSFAACFKRSTTGLPASVLRRTPASSFNLSVDRLPEGLRWLEFDVRFNQRVDALPQGLTHLAFGQAFDQPVDALPSGLTHLTLGRDFNRPLAHLPHGLTHLGLGHSFNQTLAELPTTVVFVAIPWRRTIRLSGVPLGVGVYLQKSRLYFDWTRYTSGVVAGLVVRKAS